MIQKTNDFHIKNLVKYLDKALILENAALERLPVRIGETSIDEVRQRMKPHLKHTINQKNKLEQIVFEFKERYEYIDLNIAHPPILSEANNSIKNSSQTSGSLLDTSNEKLVEDDKITIPEEVEFAK